MANIIYMLLPSDVLLDTPRRRDLSQLQHVDFRSHDVLSFWMSHRKLRFVVSKYRIANRVAGLRVLRHDAVAVCPCAHLSYLFRASALKGECRRLLCWKGTRTSPALSNNQGPKGRRRWRCRWRCRRLPLEPAAGPRARAGAET